MSLRRLLARPLKITALLLSLFLAGGPAYAGSMGLLGVGGGSAAATYQGPGDIVSGATAWGSCARAYNAAYANGTNSLCDLKDKTTGTVAICTLRVKTSGFVDLTGSYCVGSTTPAVACAAAAGGSCVISQIYDQTGNGNNWTQATLASMPSLTFAALNSLPVITCASSQTINTTNTFSTTNFSESAVYERTSGTGIGGAFGGNGNGYLGAGSVASNASISNGTTVNVSGAPDNAYHGLNGTFSSTVGADALNVDGTDNTGITAGITGLSSATLRFCRAGTQELLGNVAEGGLWPTTSFTSTQRGNLFTNQNSATSGYNGAL